MLLKKGIHKYFIESLQNKEIKSYSKRKPHPKLVHSAARCQRYRQTKQQLVFVCMNLSHLSAIRWSKDEAIFIKNQSSFSTTISRLVTFSTIKKSILFKHANSKKKKSFSMFKYLHVKVSKTWSFSNNYVCVFCVPVKKHTFLYSHFVFHLKIKTK